MAIASDGFAFVPSCVDDTTLEALRAEADSLFNLKLSTGALSEDEYLDKGCALDFFSSRGLAEDDEARVSMDEYMSRRNGIRRRRRHRSAAKDVVSNSSSGGAAAAPEDPSCPGSRSKRNGTTKDTPSSAPEPPPAPCPRKEGGARSTANKEGDADRTPRGGGPAASWTEGHVAVVRDAIFGTLASLAWDALQAEPSAAAAVARAPGGADKRLLLFNEQYVVKPPRSSIEFGWHTDEREQLAMCVFGPGVHPPVYVSVWLALDDCDAVNGCLELYPQAWNRKRLQAPAEDEQDEEAGVVCLPAKAGAAVVFLSNVWHRSGPNQTDRPRRVFYAQYCLDVIRAAPSDPRPLSLAVPCLPPSPRPQGDAAVGGGAVACPCTARVEGDGAEAARGEGRRSSSDRAERQSGPHGGGGIGGGGDGGKRRAVEDDDPATSRAAPAAPAVAARERPPGAALGRVQEGVPRGTAVLDAAESQSLLPQKRRSDGAGVET